MVACLEMLLDQPDFPVANRQTDSDESMSCAAFTSLLLDVASCFHISHIASFGILCRNCVKKAKPRASPFAALNLAGDPTFPRSIYQMFSMKKDQEEISFAERRTKPQIPQPCRILMFLSPTTSPHGALEHLESENTLIWALGLSMPAVLSGLCRS
jgi:hypothetical protein